MASFTAVIAVSLRFEGGFVDDPQDPGGATNWGITLEGLSEWRGKRCTVADVKALSLDEATEIYNARYWLPMGGPDLPAGLDLTVFDFGINAGPGRSIPMLQRLVGQVADGRMGPKTIAAAQCAGSTLLTRINALAAVHEAYYHTLPGFAHDGRGWTARVNACQAASQALANGAPAVAKVAVPKPRGAMPWAPAPSDSAATDDLNQASAAGTLNVGV